MSPKVPAPLSASPKNVLQRKPTKPPSKLRWVWLALSLIGVATVSASAGALLAVAIAGTPLLQSKLTPEEAEVFNQDEPISTSLSLRMPQLTRPVNILILGVKVLSSDVSNPPPEAQNLGYHATINSLEGLSDTMMLVRFNPEMRQLTVLSLPRDTRTWIDGLGLTKLNEANTYGGPALAARATNELLGGVGIDRYIRINVQGVEKLIDALGGVTVYVPQDMQYKDDSQHLYINLKQGEQHLNGAQALQFLRFRYDNYGDIGRIQRQQMFMGALKEQALSPSILTKLPQILSAVQSNLDTNLSVEELLALAGFASQVDRSNVRMLMLPGDFSYAEEYEASYWLPNQRKIDEITQQYFGRETVSYVSADYTETTKIAIQDSTGQPNAVQHWVQTLDTIGYGNVFVDLPWSERLATTRIIAQQGDVRTAEAIRQSLGFGEVLIESTGSLDSDITIQLGQDALQVHPVPDPTAIDSPEVAEPALQPDAIPDQSTAIP
ncbi:MAG: LCP family protein [Cyanobacteria bacterium RU_5_0]|nr:LCP family protein [Cyanobacteria bacterium RU_5_0]